MPGLGGVQLCNAVTPAFLDPNGTGPFDLMKRVEKNLNDGGIPTQGWAQWTNPDEVDRPGLRRRGDAGDAPVHRGQARALVGDPEARAARAAVAALALALLAGCHVLLAAAPLLVGGCAATGAGTMAAIQAGIYTADAVIRTACGTYQGCPAGDRAEDRAGRPVVHGDRQGARCDRRIRRRALRAPALGRRAVDRGVARQPGRRARGARGREDRGKMTFALSYRRYWFDLASAPLCALALAASRPSAGWRSSRAWAGSPGASSNTRCTAGSFTAQAASPPVTPITTRIRSISSPHRPGCCWRSSRRSCSPASSGRPLRSSASAWCSAT